MLYRWNYAYEFGKKKKKSEIMVNKNTIASGESILWFRIVCPTQKAELPAS